MFNIIFALYDIRIALFTFQVIFQAISTMKLDNTVMYKKIKKQKDKKQDKKRLKTSINELISNVYWMKLLEP